MPAMSFLGVRPIYIKYVFLRVTTTMNLYYNLYCVKKDGRFRMPTIRNWARICALKLRQM